MVSLKKKPGTIVQANQIAVLVQIFDNHFISEGKKLKKKIFKSFQKCFKKKKLQKKKKDIYISLHAVLSPHPHPPPSPPSPTVPELTLDLDPARTPHEGPGVVPLLYHLRTGTQRLQPQVQHLLTVNTQVDHITSGIHDTRPGYYF